MEFALDSVGTRVHASDADKGKEYFCPVCGDPVQPRQGDIKQWHYAHDRGSACTDDWTYDMSEWHRSWQALFPAGNREVVIAHNGEKHRADVLCYGTVIEFQHSPISESEFWRRNKFYTAAGLKLVWVFDMTELAGDNIWDEDNRLRLVDEWHKPWGDGGKYQWKRPRAFLRGFLPQDEKDIVIFIQIATFDGDPKETGIGYVERVTWVNPDQKTPWGRFHTSYKVSNYAELLNWLKRRKQQGD